MKSPAATPPKPSPVPIGIDPKPVEPVPNKSVGPELPSGSTTGCCGAGFCSVWAGCDCDAGCDCVCVFFCVWTLESPR